MQQKVYPFKFLDPYQQGDKDIFFGRKEEIRELYEMTFQSDILVVYGPSGTGKSSLIQCGLANQFKSYDWKSIAIRRNGDINASFQKALTDALNEGEEHPPAEAAARIKTAASEFNYAEAIKAIYIQYFRPIYLIFDQFEELYVLGSAEEQKEFIKSVQTILALEQPVKIILITRDEYLGHFYEFEKAVPKLLQKKLRIEPFDKGKVLTIIEGINSHPHSIVRFKGQEVGKIAEQIFEKVKGTEKSVVIQLPYLQVLMDRLYQSVAHDSSLQKDVEIGSGHIEALGNIDDVLRDFLGQQVEEIAKKLNRPERPIDADQLWQILSPFATLDGTKEPVAKKDLPIALPEFDVALVTEVVNEFVNSRILRYSDSGIYELAHDSLAKKIAAKRTDSDIAFLEVKRIIKGQVSSSNSKAEGFLNEKQLNLIEPYLGKIRAPEELRLIERSERNLQKIKAKERRNKATLGALSIGLALGILGICFLFWKESNNRAQGLIDDAVAAGNNFEKAIGYYTAALKSDSSAWYVSIDKEEYTRRRDSLVQLQASYDSAEQLFEQAELAVEREKLDSAYHYIVLARTLNKAEPIYREKQRNIVDKIRNQIESLEESIRLFRATGGVGQTYETAYERRKEALASLIDREK